MSRFSRIILCMSMLAALQVPAEEEEKALNTPKGPPPSYVMVEKVKMITESMPREYIGNVEAIEEVDIQARVSGFIETVNIKEGGSVEKGALLFEIEDTTYLAKVMAARASLEQAEAELDYAEKNYSRQKLLSEKEAISVSTLDDAERMFKMHRARLKQRKAELIDSENRLEYTRISSPIQGRIGKISKTCGNYVSLSSRPLAKIVSLDPIHVKFSISERIYQNLFKTYKAQNDRFDVTIRLANGDIYPRKGRIAFADNVVDADTGTISVWVEFDNPDWMLIPGGYVCAIVSEKREKPLPGVKASAIVTDSKANFVYVLGPGNIPARRDVRIGEMLGDYYTIKEGLADGETVVVDGTHKVVPGMPVKPVQARKKGSRGIGKSGKKTGK